MVQEKDEGKVKKMNGGTILEENEEGFNIGENIEIPKKILNSMDDFIFIIKEMSKFEEDFILKGLLKDENIKEYIRSVISLEIENVDENKRLYTLFRKTDGKKLISFIIETEIIDNKLHYLCKEKRIEDEYVLPDQVKIINSSMRMLRYMEFINKKIDDSYNKKSLKIIDLGDSKCPDSMINKLLTNS